MAVILHQLNCGSMCPRVPASIAPPMVCRCWLVESDRGLVLVDTGLGQHDIDHPIRRLTPLFVLAAWPRLDPDETAVAQIRRLGHRPEDVTDIVLTHLDVDHAGGIADFPHARIHLHEAELAAASRLWRYRRIQWSHGPRWVTHSGDGEAWHGFSRVRPLPDHDDLWIVGLPGHTPGHIGVAVRTADGVILHAGDAFFHHGQLDPDRPHAPPGLRLFQRLADHDTRARVDHQRRLRRLANDVDAGVTVVCAHDPHPGR